MTLKRIEKLLHTPIVLILIVICGLVFGLKFPLVAKIFHPFTEIYLNLLKMVVLPFLVSSIIFGLRSLVREANARSYVYRLFGSMIGVAVIAALLGVALAFWVRPGDISDPTTRIEFGEIVSSSGNGTDMQMNLHGPLPQETANPLLDMMINVVPSNVFQSLADGDVVKVLIFSVFFGLAVGHVQHSISEPFGFSLETVYRTCMVLTGWFTRFLPIVTFAMVAQHAAAIGPGTLWLMINFLLAMALAMVATIVLSIAVISIKARRPVGMIIRRCQEIAGMSLSTNSSVACIPTIIDALIKLGFRRDVAELMVPLNTALVRAGPIVCYAIAPIFIAQLYGRVLTPSDLIFLFASAALLGTTTAGMSGMLVLAQIGIICDGLRLPFEAAFVLLASVDEFTNTLRTLILVFATAASVAVITPLAKATEPAATEEDDILLAHGKAA